MIRAFLSLLFSRSAPPLPPEAEEESTVPARTAVAAAIEPEPAAAPLPPAPAPPPLRAYCDTLLRAVAARGYTVLHGTDLHETRSPVSFSGGIAARRAARAEWDRATDDGDHKNLLAAVINGANGFVRAADDQGGAVCVLPDERGALAAAAAEYGLNPAKLTAAGLTDFDFYAHIAVHEASHILGNREPGADDVMTPDEHSTYALHTARLLHNGQAPATVALLNDMLLARSLYIAIAAPDKKSAYVMAPGGAALALRAAANPGAWNRAADSFAPVFYDRLRGYDTAYAAYDGALASVARAAILRPAALKSRVEAHGQTLADPFFNLRLRDCAFSAARRLRARGTILPGGPDDNLRAALLLQTMGRALDNIARYADVYYAPHPPLPARALSPGPAPAA